MKTVCLHLFVVLLVCFSFGCGNDGRSDAATERPEQSPAPAQPQTLSDASPTHVEPVAKDNTTSVPPSEEASPTTAPKKPVPTQTSANQSLTLGELRAKYADFFRVSGKGDRRVVALTFDDGPDQYFTPKVLDVLKQYGVKATFFVVGKHAEKYPDTVRRIVQEGHVIGNHSYGHPLFTTLGIDDFREEIEHTDRVLHGLTGYSPTFIRPPYGAINEEQLQWIQSKQMIVVNWNVDSLDWKSISKQQVSNNILGHTKAGSIVLQHSGPTNGPNLTGTLEALPAIIESLHKQGYQLVTVPDLLQMSAQR